MNAPVLNAARLGAEMPAPAAPMNARTLMLLTGPIAPTLHQARLAERAGDAGAGVDRPDRDLVGVASGNRRPDRNGAGLSRVHDDGDAVGGRGRRRHFVGGRPRARGRPAGGRRRARRPRASDQRRPRPRDLGAVPRLRAATLRRHGRPRRLARGGDAIFERRIRRQHSGVADERARQRRPRNRQHAVPVNGDLHRRHAC